MDLNPYVGRNGLCHTCPQPHHGVRYDVAPDMECEDCGLQMHSDAMAMATDLGQRGGDLGDPCPRCHPGKQPKPGEGSRMVSVAVRLARKLGKHDMAGTLLKASKAAK